MREILFRAKQHYTKEWLYGAVVKDGDECLITVGDSDGLYKQKMTVVEESTVGQFTGLLDKHGRKIFEGDIVAKDVFQKRERIDSDGNKLHVFEINKPKIQKTAVVEYCSKRGKFDTGTPEICFDFASDFYIIGNIHDNPELLEVK